MPDFRMTYDNSAEASEYLAQQTKAIANIVEALAAAVNSVMGELEGTTAQAYQAKHVEWQNIVGEMGRVLNLGATSLVDLTANYRTTDVNEGNRWGDITVR
ncbi:MULTISPECIES: WXG100 family type VII secretion target [Streptomyces]|uniref:WXG100 family type VII secretion target n=2 Tax=Streptomyces TaxID=1883 RepID=A0ABV9J870_9ACTN